MNLPVTSVARCIDSKARTLGLKILLRFPDMGASGAPLDREHAVYELFKQQDSIPVGQNVPPV